MGGIRIRAAIVCAAFLAWGACANQRDKLDLADNDQLYRTPSYQAKMPADRSAFVTPLVDDRDSVEVVEAAGPFPTRWMAEGFWDRTVPEMLDDCLRQAFEESAVFAGMEQAPPPSAAALIVDTHLLEARGGQEERLYGRRTIGVFSVRVVIRGPLGEDGTRPELFDEQFDQTVATDVSPNPERVPLVMGRALEQLVGRILAKIDQSNVARSGL